MKNPINCVNIDGNTERCFVFYCKKTLLRTKIVMTTEGYFLSVQSTARHAIHLQLNISTNVIQIGAVYNVLLTVLGSRALTSGVLILFVVLCRTHVTLAWFEQRSTINDTNP
jgi:hypothetical protein